MPQESTWTDFNAGWIPSDDAQGGRKNGLLRMDNVELDKNGSLSLIGGAKILQTPTAKTIALYDTIIGGAEILYSATNNGKINKAGTELISFDPQVGDSEIAAFGNAFNFVLAVSGDNRIKNDGANTYQLGLDDLAAPTLTLAAGNYTAELVIGGASTYSYNFVTSSGTSATPSFSYTGGTPAVLLVTGSGTLPLHDWTTLPNGGDGSTFVQSPDDLINISLTANSGNLSTITQIRFTIYAGGGFAGYTVTRAFSLTAFDTTLNLIIKRSEFVGITVGVNSPDWSKVTNFQLLIDVTGALDITFGGTVIPVVDAALTPPSTHFAFYRGLHSLDTPQLINYAIVPVASFTDSYVALGAGTVVNNGVYSNISVPGGADVQVTFVPSTDPQVTAVWVYRQGGDLAQWYRVLVAVNDTSAHIDTTSDVDALEINVVLNLNTFSVQGAGLIGVNNKFYTILGPIEGRWYYFTDKFMYPSEINDPDLLNASVGVRTCGSDNELFMWAVKVAEGYVLVGTTVDIYVLSGTFTTLPDGVIDIYYRPMVCKHPPITRDATFANGLVYYLAADGWRSIGTSAEATQLLVAPNTDQLYVNVDRYGYNPSSSYGMIPGAKRFPVIVTKNKLWCCVDDRIEVWDFVRHYWRPVNYQLGGVSAITAGLNGNPIASYINDFGIRELDTSLATIESVDSPTPIETLQTVSILSPVIDPTQSLNRCDLYTLKVRCSTGLGENLACSLILADGTSYFIGNATSYTELEQQIVLDINSVIPFPTTTFQFYLTGKFTKFLLSDIRVDYDSRPNQVTALRIYNTNFGTAGKKRLRMWPIIIDTLGNDVRYIPFVDNIQGTTQILNSNEKSTLPVFYNFDAFGTDYGVLLSGGPFEFWEMGSPEIVQALPVPKMYDQVGPQELFRYGKIREFEIRLVPYGGDVGTTSNLPYTFYFDDFSVCTGILAVNNGQEQTYSFGVPKGVAGTIVRVELGPVDYQFVRYYLRVRAVRHANDSTDNSSWVTL
jgi:hypothetical protein